MFKSISVLLHCCEDGSLPGAARAPRRVSAAISCCMRRAPTSDMAITPPSSAGALRVLRTPRTPSRTAPLIPAAWTSVRRPDSAATAVAPSWRAAGGSPAGDAPSYQRQPQRLRARSERVEMRRRRHVRETAGAPWLARWRAPRAHADGRSHCSTRAISRRLRIGNMHVRGGFSKAVHTISTVLIDAMMSGSRLTVIDINSKCGRPHSTYARAKKRSCTHKEAWATGRWLIWEGEGLNAAVGWASYLLSHRSSLVARSTR